MDPFLTDEQLENWFMHHPPEAGDPERYQAIRAAGLLLAKTIRDHSPVCADQTAAIRKCRETVMTANAAIACKGK